MISVICPSPKGKDIAFKLQRGLNANLYIKQRNDDIQENIYDQDSKIEVNTDKGYNIYRYREDFKMPI